MALMTLMAFMALMASKKNLDHGHDLDLPPNSLDHGLGGLDGLNHEHDLY